MAVGQLAEVIAAPYNVWVASTSLAESTAEFPPLSVGWQVSEASTEATTKFTAGTFSGWSILGTSGFLNYADAGVTVSHGQAQQAFVSAGAITPRKKWRTEETMKVQLELVDLSPKQYARIMDEATVTVSVTSEESLQLKRKIRPAFYRMLVRGASPLNEEKNAQYEIATCVQSGNAAPKFSLKAGPAMLAIEFDVLELEAGKWAIFRANK